MAQTSAELRMTEGSIPKHIIRFAVPLFLGNLFQQLYNAADTLIVGRLLGDSALAAVSSSGSLLFLLVGFFSGIFMGAGVVISQYYGAKDVSGMRRAVHSTLLFALASGVFLTIAATLLAPQILVWMDTPPEVLPRAVSYVRVYFSGVLSMILYNACMSIMQAVGDSRHPLYYLIISSLINIVLDILFIAAFHYDVGSAALATVISQFVSVFLCLFRLMRIDADYRIDLRALRFDGEMLGKIIRYGLPSGFQNSIIAFANVVVQSNINAFGEAAMAGCGAYAKIEGFAFLPVTCFTAAITTFVGQNLGAQEYERTKKGARFGILVAIVMAECIGLCIYVTAPFLIGLFTDGAEAIAFGVDKAHICSVFFCLCAMSHCFAAVLRGAGRAVVPMLAMMCCWCVIRVSILAICVPIFKDIAIVNWVYPITWALCAGALFVYYKKADWMHGVADVPKKV